LDNAEIIATISALPGRIEALVAGLSREDAGRRPSDAGWSVLEVCCHLRDAGEYSLLRIRRLANEDGPVLEPYDEVALAIERNYRGDELSRVLPPLREAWTELAELLASLPEAAWARSGTHPERGRLTLESEARRYAEHASMHLAQLEAALQR
jgi:hypothetical protein